MMCDSQAHTIDYVHARNTHTAAGATTALPIILQTVGISPVSLIDVGCGTGTWLRAALKCGVRDVMGIEGVVAPAGELQADESLIITGDLTTPLDIGRRFDVALCLEVAEHLEPAAAETLVESLVSLADIVIFSAACPGQPGQHHVNCQWPAYWQNLFNRHSFACSDEVRRRIWDLEDVEPWYRQNMFVARRDPAAGSEQRIAGILNPAMVVERIMLKDPIRNSRTAQLQEIAAGSMPIAWYLTTPILALFRKAWRALSRLRF